MSDSAKNGAHGALYFCGGALIGVPIAWTIAIHWSVWIVVPLISGGLAARYGDYFFDAVADSDWWAALSAMWRH